MHTWDDRGILSSGTYAINDKSPVALFTKIRQYNLNFFTYDFPKIIPKSFSQRLSYDKF